MENPLRAWGTQMREVAQSGDFGGTSEEVLFDMLQSSTESLGDETWRKGLPAGAVEEQLGKQRAIAAAAAKELDKRPGGIEGVVERVVTANDAFRRRMH